MRQIPGTCQQQRQGEARGSRTARQLSHPRHAPEAKPSSEPPRRTMTRLRRVIGMTDSLARDGQADLDHQPEPLEIHRLADDVHRPQFQDLLQQFLILAGGHRDHPALIPLAS